MSFMTDLPNATRREGDGEAEISKEPTVHENFITMNDF